MAYHRLPYFQPLDGHTILEHGRYAGRHILNSGWGLRIAEHGLTAGRCISSPSKG